MHRVGNCENFRFLFDEIFSLSKEIKMVLEEKNGESFVIKSVNVTNYVVLLNRITL